jgi:4-amino-4-deoxy-L-arabinose transferase-like glycosyltransferase
MDPDTDSVAYVELAHGLQHGCGFARISDGNCLSPEVNRTPGYPIFLSVMPDLWVAVIAQALLSGVTIFALGGFVSARWGFSAGLVTATLVALDVPSIVYSDEIMSETLFTSAFLLGVLAGFCAANGQCDKRRRFALELLSSLLLGFAILVRPIGQLAVAVPSMIPLAFAGTPRLKRIGFVALVVSIPVIVVAGWSLRNYRLSGVAAFSTVSALNLFYYRAGGTLAYASHVGWLAELHNLTPPDRQTSLTKAGDQNDCASSRSVCQNDDVESSIFVLRSRPLPLESPSRYPAVVSNEGPWLDENPCGARRCLYLTARSFGFHVSR